MVDSNLIVSETYRERRTETVSYYVPTRSSIKNLSNFIHYIQSRDSFFRGKKISFIKIPINLPLIIKPKPYIFSKDNKLTQGGYYLEESFSSMIIQSPEQLNISRIPFNMPLLYSVINNLNSVGYCVNKELLSFIQSNGPLFDLLNINNPPFNPSKSKLTTFEKKQLQEFYSKVELQNHLLTIADVYSNVPEFYFVNRIDFRGRINCATTYFNYQGNELAKALLLFSKPSKISRLDYTKSEEYLKIYGANCFGNKIEKKSFQERILWVENNLEGILNYENGDLIKKAENKFLFTAFCIEFKRWYNFLSSAEELYFYSFLPLQLDASCNGFQHLVLLTKEVKLWNMLNLTEKHFNELPSDFYLFIQQKFISLIETSLSSNNIDNGTKNLYNKILKMDLNRKDIKHLVMIEPYNATDLKMIDELSSHFRSVYDPLLKTFLFYKEEDPSLTLNNKELRVVIKIFRQVIEENGFKINKLKSYLVAIAKCCTALKLPIS